MSAQRVVVLFGGRSPEHEVSFVSARSVLAHLDRKRWTAVPMAVARDGSWLSPEQSQELLDAEARGAASGGLPLAESQALQVLASCDVVLPLIHGTNGEDGTLQGLLEMLGVAYTGCGVAASAIGMDKAYMRALFREAGVPQPRYMVMKRWELDEAGDEARRAIASELGYPVFVKPANGGSSVGITRAASPEDLEHALATALVYDDKVLVEGAVIGQEVECSVLGNEQISTSVIGEIVPDRDFYSYESKYATDSQTQLNIPARLDEATAERVRELAARVYSVMGCEGFSRVDFFVTGDGDVLANEVNTIPGFTTISMYPKLWEATGLGYSELLTRILELGLARHARRSVLA